MIYETDTDNLKIYNGSSWVTVGGSYGVATGGTSSSITVDGQNYTLLTFTGDGTLTVTKAGLFDVLLIGGGSSALSGWASNGRPGSPGGGAGGAIERTIYLNSNQSITIGAGGADPTTVLEYYYGTSTSIGSVLASGSASARGNAPSWAATEAVRVAAQGGNAGGSVGGSDGGGGGGLGAAGSGRNGGAGADYSSFRGQTAGTTYYGGGGGGQSSGGTNGTGGIGGGGGGTVAGSANTGGGGGGGDSSTAAGGGSGIALIRFKV